MIENTDDLERALRLLGGHLELVGGTSIRLVVCGGAALLARSLRDRATQDVDVLAMMDDRGSLVAPMPLPEDLLAAAVDAGRTLGLPEDWVNNDASRDEIGLFQMGLPPDLTNRLVRRDYGGRLSVYFVGRLDLIHFKLFAAANAGTRHTDDLIALAPTRDELLQASRWLLSTRRGAGIKERIVRFLRFMGHEHIAENL